MNKTLFSVGLAAIALAGCATTPRCELMDGREICASMKDAHMAALAGGGSKDNVLAPVDGMGGDPKKAPAAPLNFQAGRHQLAGPVFVPPQPYRFWVAPWQDGTNMLHSGEQMFFTTPGHWNYGEMAQPGAAGELIAPVRPEDLGFTPIIASSADKKGKGSERIREQRRSGITLPEKEITKLEH